MSAMKDRLLETFPKTCAKHEDLECKISGVSIELNALGNILSISILQNEVVMQVLTREGKLLDEEWCDLKSEKLWKHIAKALQLAYSTKELKSILP